MSRARTRKVVALGAAAVALVAAPGAVANSGDFTWTGGAPSSNANGWSATANWQGGTAPSGSIGTLTFPDLSSCDAGASTTCYDASDDIGDQTVGQLAIDDDRAYGIDAHGSAATLTLNGLGSPVVGLTAAPAEPADFGSTFGQPGIDIPVIVGSDQTWNIAGDGTFADDGVAVYSVTGPHALTVNFTGESLLATSDMETATVTATGSGLLVAGDGNTSTPGISTLPTGGTNLENGAALEVQAPQASTGPLAITGGSASAQSDVQLGPGDLNSASTLTVNGDASFDEWANIFFALDANGNVPGTDFSQLGATGTIALGYVTLELQQGAGTSDDCTTLAPGQSFPVVTAASLTGDATYVNADGVLETLAPGQTSGPVAVGAPSCATGAPSTPATAVLSYGPDSITATIVQAPEAGTLPPQITGNALAGSTLSLSSFGDWTASPAATYTYQWFACSASSCSAISGATSSSYATTAAEVGETLKLQITAGNAAGSATAYSNSIGPVSAPASTSGTSSGAMSPSDGPDDSAMIAAIHTIDLPHSSKSIRAFIDSGAFGTTFAPASAGDLYIVWTTTITSKRDKHQRATTITLVRENVTCAGTGSQPLTIELTKAGRSLVRSELRRALRHGLRVREAYKFNPSPSHLPYTVVESFGL